MKSDCGVAFDGTADFEKLAAAISDLRKAKAGVTFRIGLTLLEAKEALGHGRWLDFLRDGRVGFHPRQAQRLMDIAREPDGEALAQFGVTKAGLLLQIRSVDERSRFLAENEVASLSKPKLRKKIDAFLGVAANGSQAGARKKKARAAAGCEFSAAGTRTDWALGVLHLTPDGLTAAAVDSAFRELAGIFHPDHGRTVDGRFMRDLVEARGVLKNASR